MFAMLGNILAAIVAFFSKEAVAKGAMIAWDVFKWIVVKAFIGSLVFIILPIVAYNFILGFINDALIFGLNYIDSSGLTDNGLVLNLTGMAGYIATAIGLPSMFSMFMSAVWIRFVLNALRL